MSSTIILFSSFSLLFFIMSLFSKRMFIIPLFNIFFLVLCYGAITSLLGTAKPVMDIFMFTHNKYDADGVVVVGGWWNDETIYLILNENNIAKLYSWPMNGEFLQEIKKAKRRVKDNTDGQESWGFKLKGNKNSGYMNIDQSYPTVPLPDPVHPKEIIKDAPPEDGSNVHDVTVQ